MQRIGLLLSTLLYISSSFGFVELTTATFVVDDGLTPPAEVGKAIELPFAPRAYHEVPKNTAMWFRLEPKALGDYAEPAIYIWRHNVSASVFLNGERIGGQLGPQPGSDGLAPIGWNQPVLVTVPRAALRQNNVVHIRVQAGTFGGMMSSVIVGETADLQPLFDARHFWQIETSRWGFTIVSALGIFVFLLWLRRRQDSQYLLFAGACLCYAVMPLYMFLDVIPLPLEIWLGIVHSGGTWCTYFLIRFFLTATGKSWPRFHAGLLAVSATATLFHFFYPEGYFFDLAYLFHLVSFSALIFVGVVMLIDSVRRPGGASTWISIGYLVMGGLVARDSFYFMSGGDEYLRASNLMQLGIPFMLLVLFAHLVNRFMNALDESEALNRDLEARVDANRRALESSYEENRRMELLESAAREREKIYRDLHDDVGSKLVNIVHAGDSERDVSLARSALESLREAIYRANYQDQPIGKLLQDLHQEIDLRTSNAGLTLDWQQDVKFTDTVLDSELCFHVSRIFRELITNVLHHAHARTVSFELASDGTCVECRIADDGSGIGEGEICAGNGIKNIRHRINTIGGKIDWCSEPGHGTAIQLSFPIKVAASA